MSAAPARRGLGPLCLLPSAAGSTLCRTPSPALPHLRSEYVPELDAAGAPTGALQAVAGTPLDFRAPHAIGERIEEAGGYIATYLLFGLGPDSNMSQAVPNFQAADT